MDPDVNYFRENFDISSGTNATNVFSLSEYNEMGKNNSHCLSIFSRNIRSFSKNIDHLLCSFESKFNLPDILVLQETWFSQSSIQILEGYNSYNTLRQTGRYGGVSVFVKETLISCNC